MAVIEKNGFYIAIGKQGSGKTALITSLAVNEYLDDKRLILSNYQLFDIPYLKIDLPTILELIKNDELIKTIYYENNTKQYDIADEFKKIKGYYPTSNNDYLNNTIILLDEIHIYFDAYDFLKQENRVISAFASQLRKRNTLLLATTQYILNVSIRLRKQVKFVFDICKSGKIYECSVDQIDGYFTDHVKTIKLDLQDYYKYYDTNEIIKP